MSVNRTARLIALTGVAVVAAGCTAAEADRSGGGVTPAELVLASSDRDLTGAPAVAHFVDRVEELSGGRLIVRLDNDFVGEDAVIEGVADGDADLGWSGTRAFDTVGLDTFQPLHAPFLVGSYAAQAAVVRDDLAGDLLASLEPLGLTGLGLAADQLRMPAAAAAPLLAPEDFSGLVVRTMASEIQAEALRALGAHPTTAGSPGDSEGVDAIETMWWTYQEHQQHEYAPFLTRNAVLWPRTVALFANAATLDDLDEESQAWVTEAAADAVGWSLEHADDEEAGHMELACQGQTRVATATADQLAALRAAAEPVYDALRQDDALADILGRIEELVADVPEAEPLPLPDGCAYIPGDEDRVHSQPAPDPGPGDSGDLPQGVYRYALSIAELRDAGFSRDDAEFNAGVFTWTVSEGAWTYEQAPEVPEAVPFTTCGGTYDVGGDTVTFTTSTEVTGGSCAPPSWTARFAIEDERLVWADISEEEFELVFAPAPWERIG